MELFSKSMAWLHIPLGLMGISQVKATTDTPGARIELTWNCRGVEHNSSFTLEELLADFTETTTGERTGPQGNFTDINDLPDGDLETRPEQAENPAGAFSGDIAFQT